MNFKTLLVQLELNGDNEGILKIATELAARFDSKVIGIAAAQPVRVLYDEGCTAGEVMAEDRVEIVKETNACKTQFQQALKGKVRRLEWRSTVTFDSLADFIVEQARAADLVITGKDIGGALLDNTRRVNVGQLAVMAGRPILLVPQGITTLPLRHVFVAWRDSREARRAAADALPFLEAAGHATVVEVASDRDRAEAETHVKDVSLWLEQHKLSATPLVLGTTGAQGAFIRAELLQRNCDLLVAGAFGHNRLGEWVFGGITQDILLDPDFCVLLSH